MNHVRSSARRIAVLAVLVLAGASPGLVTGPAAGSQGGAAHHRHGSTERSQVVLDWERILIRTVYTDAATPIPIGVPVLGFTSVALQDAVSASRRHRHSSETAAAATAAHDVLIHYYPGAEPKLDADLTTSLAAVADSRSKERGIRIGRSAAADMLARRVGDGYLDPMVHYTLAPAPGIWEPAPPATDMLAAWLGSLRPLVLRRPVHVSGPDKLKSAQYARDFAQVKRLGRDSSTARSPEQTATALFFNSNSATMVGDALLRHLEANPISLEHTATLFARMHAAMTDSVIRCWQLKRDVGFWRPSQAIAGADSDGNPRTTSEAGWTPLVPNPNYSDYVSGHACLTAPAVETIRRTLGEHTPLELRSVNSPTPRVYTRLSRIEHDAFKARIWSGLHFRRAMIDGYDIGHRTARDVFRSLGDR